MTRPKWGNLSVVLVSQLKAPAKLPGEKNC